MTTTEKLRPTNDAEARQAVSNGAKLLDEKVPGWADYDFDWEKFDLGDPKWCVIGQLRKSDVTPWEGYSSGINAVGATEYGDAYHYAFCGVGWDAVNPRVYRDAWKEEVEARQGQVVIREVVPEGAVVLDADAKALLIELLTERSDDLREQALTLKPQYRRYLDPQRGEVGALIATLRAAR